MIRAVLTRASASATRSVVAGVLLSAQVTTGCLSAESVASRIRLSGEIFMPLMPGVRRSLAEIQAEYESGDKEVLET